ncbi:MAG: SMP-30/gluconolactonase/LRE family protein [Parasphingopyxis sp.]|uniref:SMP-30/gluconolactonase/LRE family protein n=1 Tax=Parasphingopyxis sp. TaxID=1920299 RepID=UPI003F9F7C4A
MAEAFIEAFDGAEGITFNARGDLFIGANRGVWIARPDGSVRRLADVYTNLGQAPIGERDILAADFGPTNIFSEGDESENDGIVWRVTPEGERTVFATGIADPNFILPMPDGSFLVSDDGTDIIYRIDADRNVSIWSRAVPFPNGMVVSPDGRTLYVAQIFTRLAPIEFADRLWAVEIGENGSAGAASVVLETGGAGLDGLAIDESGRVYIADNQVGRIWRFDPETGEQVLIAEDVPNVASLVFGRGAFDHHALYATSTFRGGGTIWRIPVGVRGSQ